MANPIAKNNSVIGIKAETTEGTYAAPASATDYIQPLADGFELSPKKEQIERNILTSSIGKVTPRVGIRSVSGALPVELRASGVEGQETDFDVLLQSALGSRRQLAARITTKASGNTGTRLQIADADIASLNVGDMFVVLEAGAHVVCAVTAKDSTGGAAHVDVVPGRATGVFPNSVQISKFSTYVTANSGHPTFSVSNYWANEILEKAMGCRVTSLGIDSFSTGKIAGLKFGFDGIAFDEVDGSAAHIPSFDSGLPPLILGAFVYQDGVSLEVNQFSVNLQNEVSFKTATSSVNGRVASRITKRSVSGSINPYKDDTSVANFTKFNNQTPFNLMVFAANPSAVAGELELGSVVAIYLPHCVMTEKKVGDEGGLLVDQISFSSDRGNGSTEEMYLGFI